MLALHMLICKDVYVDADQIDNMYRLNKIPIISFADRRVAIEAPAWKEIALPTRQMHINFSLSAQLPFSVTVPFHARYRKPSLIEEYESVDVIDKLSIMDSKKEELPYRLTNPFPQIRVPVALQEDESFISYLTLLVSFAGLLVLILFTFS